MSEQTDTNQTADEQASVSMINSFSKNLFWDSNPEVLKLNDRKHFREQYLHPAFKENLIALLYPENPKRKGQKYYLTEKGKNVLKHETN